VKESKEETQYMFLPCEENTEKNHLEIANICYILLIPALQNDTTIFNYLCIKK
jgi:hypothetical protein